ncbi:hypothetical protein [Crucivirus-419]|nr:hypothetical protein [Crucivirus-419]
MKRSFSSTRFDSDCMTSRVRLYFNALRRIGKPTSHLRIRLLQYLEQFFGDIVKAEWDEVHDQAIDEFFESYRFRRIEPDEVINETDVLRAVNDESNRLRRPAPAMTLDQAEDNLSDSEHSVDTTSSWQRIQNIPAGRARRSSGAPRQLQFQPDIALPQEPMSEQEQQRQANLLASYEAAIDEDDEHSGEYTWEMHRDRNTDQ